MCIAPPVSIQIEHNLFLDLKVPEEVKIGENIYIDAFIHNHLAQDVEVVQLLYCNNI